MRICHVLETSGGGSGQVVLDLLQMAHESGDEITLLYSLDRAEPQFLAALQSLKGRVSLQPSRMQRAVGLHDLRDGLALHALLREKGPFDIIHSHSSKAGALARIAGILIPGARHVYTPHAFITMATDASPLYGWVEWLLSWLCDAVVCVSEQEKRHALEQLRISSRKLHVVPNGVSLSYPASRAEARTRMDVADGELVVGFVGRLVSQKNPARLVEAFALAARELPNLRLVIVGDGPLRGETEDSLAARGLSHRARLMGGCSGRDLMPGFDCLLCTSDYESFGLVLLEALAAGVPVVTTPVGIAEVAVGQDQVGLVTKGFQAEELASALMTLARRDETRLGEMRARARAQAEKFSVEVMRASIRSLYARIVASTGSGPRLAASPLR